ncbi:type II toxin-antitoxin system HicB family antitoxin [Treponema sp. HNW]|uniref:type II toxin-antitoxin system HicB family antitoxin n=1 Tax=Treponema sp. HNW TaxID=3116654 RepID=UPI003D0C2B8D
MKYTYPVIFEKDGLQISVSVPDIPGCFTCADTIPQAIEMAADALAMMLAHYEDNKQSFSPPSPIENIKAKDGFVSYVLADTDLWRKQFSEKAVKKTVTIPAWLNYKAEAAGINFSQTLQQGLKKALNS